MMKYLCIVLLMAGGCVAVGENNEEQIFCRLIHEGFQRDMLGDSKAKWLGSGELEITHIDVVPNVKFIPAPEGNKEMVSRCPYKDIKKLRESQPIESTNKGTWAAWVDNKGLLNLAISPALEESEELTIEALQRVSDWKAWNIKTDWTVDTKSFIGYGRFGDNWNVNVSKGVSHIFLGEYKKGSFSQAKNILAGLKIISW